MRTRVRALAHDTPSMLLIHTGMRACHPPFHTCTETHTRIRTRAHTHTHMQRSYVTYSFHTQKRRARVPVTFYIQWLNILVSWIGFDIISLTDDI